MQRFASGEGRDGEARSAVAALEVDGGRAVVGAVTGSGFGASQPSIVAVTTNAARLDQSREVGCELIGVRT
jgi:hypothetical protein